MVNIESWIARQEAKRSSPLQGVTGTQKQHHPGMAYLSQPFRSLAVAKKWMRLRFVGRE